MLYILQGPGDSNKNAYIQIGCLNYTSSQDVSSPVRGWNISPFYYPYCCELKVQVVQSDPLIGNHESVDSNANSAHSSAASESAVSNFKLPRPSGDANGANQLLFVDNVSLLSRLSSITWLAWAWQWKLWTFKQRHERLQFVLAFSFRSLRQRC